MDQDQTTATDPNGAAGTDQHESRTAVGNLLRASRRRVGQDLRDVARILRIRYPYLEALEEGRYADLPGAAYAVGFVRAYAEHLGLDSAEIVRRYKAETADAAKKTDLVFPSPVTETVMPGGAIIFIGIVLAGLAYGVWYMSTSEDNPLADAISPLPERLSEMLNKPAAPGLETKSEPAKPAQAPQETQMAASVSEESRPVTEATPSVTEPVAKPEPTPSAADEETPVEPAAPPVVEAVSEAVSEVATETDVRPEAVASAPVEETTEAVPVADVKTEPKTEGDPTPSAESAPDPVSASVDVAKTAPVAEPAPALEAAPEAVLPKIVVRGKAASWIQVRDDDAKVVIMTRVLRAGDTYEVPNRTGLSLVASNAGALEILVDGDLVPAIGDAGAVRRSVSLDAGKLKAGTAVSE